MNLTGKHFLMVIKISLAILLAFLLAHLTKGWFGPLIGVSTDHETDESHLFDLYSRSSANAHKPFDNDAIVIISIDQCGRTDIAKLIKIVNECAPAVIGLDVIFEKPQITDSLLINAIDSANNLILPVKPYYDSQKARFISYSGSYFYNKLKFPHKYASVILSDNKPHELIRHFYPYFDVDGQIIPSFGTCLAEQYDSDAIKVLRDRGHSLEYINFTSYSYKILNGDDVIKEWISKGMIDRCKFKDKIVIIGDPYDVKDLKNTPVGNKPGCVVIASIVSTILGSNYMNVTQSWIIIFLSVLLCFSFLFAKIHFENNNNSVGGLLSRLFQFAVLLVLLLLGSSLFSRHNLYVDLSYPILMTGYCMLSYDILAVILLLIRKLTTKLLI